MGLANLLLPLALLPHLSPPGVMEGTRERPLLAHWAMDEITGVVCYDSRGHAYHAQPVSGAVQRIPGVLGNALSFSGSHRLAVTAGPDFTRLEAVTLSAWVAPTELTGYREIFRKEDGDKRVLFSFQLDGTILSLGLNIGGYVECDAPLDPRQVQDGRWHHCAASFDRQTMRVYLDGREIGSLVRPGTINAGGPADGCLGSLNGGEPFQGLMDDLRIYAEALTADEVAALYREGLQALARAADAPPGDEPELEAPLVAHWTFNEAGVSPLVAEVAAQPPLEARAQSPLVRVRGVHGNALRLGGSHALALVRPPDWGELTQLSLCAWVRPTDLSGFHEIFRQECGERVLFSFQESGTVLSLGLNVGGYVECDADIKPQDLLDGDWHHCAATYDGQSMRVYLDGREVGALNRAGPLVTSRHAPAFIGSTAGQGEHFQGALDDLRLYRAALSPGQVAMLYQRGREALGLWRATLRQRLEQVHARRETFARTLAQTRQNLTEKALPLDFDLADLLALELRQAFGPDCEEFATITGLTPVEFAVARDDNLQEQTAQRLVELMLEYRPLTSEQRARQTPQQAQEWQEAEQVAARLEILRNRGAEARFSPEWVELMLQAGRRVQFRPAVHEPVAPYVPPATPQTRDLTEAQAREVLERDWLYQAGGQPTPERIRQEIGWARDIAGRLLADWPRQVDVAVHMRQLEALEQQAAATTEPDAALYFRVREIKRELLMSSPALDFHEVLFVDMPYPQGSEWAHETRHRLGYMAVPGGRLLVLSGLSPGGKLRQLMPQPPLHGSFWRPDVSFDGRRVLFCFKPHNEKSFHLYEIGADGTGLRQLTDGPYDDLDPIYLPDGEHVLFCTTRGHTYVRCMPPTNAFILARCKLDGSDIYLVSQNNEPDYLPSVMHDGRVVYTRWEYTDKPLWRAQGLWTMHPDGTQVSTLWGNQSVWPDLLKDARSIPGSQRVMFTGSAHHDWFSGSVGIIDPGRGFNFPDGLTKVTAEVPWPEVGNGPRDPVESSRYHTSGDYDAYYSPYPLSEREFLVSARRGGKFRLYLMDVDGNRELIYEGVHNILHAVPLKARPRPPVIHDQVAWPTREQRQHPQDGILYSYNVYDGAPPQLRGRARFLRVLAIDPKTYTYWYKRPYISTGPVVSLVQSEGVKRILGTVPIEQDGSVAFFAPPGKALHFQLLDDEQRALQTMRSFVGVMPGERRGCLGCHELHSTAPANGRRPRAVREPRAISPPPWDDRTVSWARYVRPVLDRYCARCHEGTGEARRTLDLTPRPGMLGWDETYALFTGYPTWGAPYQPPPNPPAGWGIADMLMVEGYSTTDPAGYRTPEPMTRLSHKSRLIELVSSGKHHGVKVDPVSRLRLICWVDAMCPYLGEEEVRQIPDPQFQGVDWLAIRPRIATAPVIPRPGPVD